MAEMIKRLEEYPELDSWFKLRQGERPSASDGASFLAWSVLNSLKTERVYSLDEWTKSLETFLSYSGNALDDYIEVEAFLKAGCFSLSEFVSDMGERAILSGEGLQYLKLMKLAADKTGLVSYRFMAAWVALNIDMLDECINECEKVDDIYSPIYTIQGQALLDLGKAREAVDVLSVATKVEATNTLAWFQLTKAYFVLDEFDEAWNSAMSCLDLAKGNVEVPFMVAIIAIRSKSKDRCKIAWDILSSYLFVDSDNSALISMLFDLSFVSENKTWVKIILDKADWNLLRENGDFNASLGSILRFLGDLGWYDISEELLGFLTEKLEPEAS